MSTQTIEFDVVAFFSQKHEEARLMKAGEVIPSSLEAAFDILGMLDPEWVWVLAVDGLIKGVLIASPCHGAAALWRLSVEKGQSNMAVGRLLRAFLRDCRKRGVKGYLTFLTQGRPAEDRLASILEHSGGKKIKGGMVLYASPMPRETI